MSEDPREDTFELKTPVGPLSAGDEQQLEDDLIRGVMDLILADFNRDPSGSGNSIPVEGYKLSIRRFSVKRGC